MDVVRRACTEARRVQQEVRDFAARVAENVNADQAVWLHNAVARIEVAFDEFLDYLEQTASGIARTLPRSVTPPTLERSTAEEIVAAFDAFMRDLEVAVLVPLENGLTDKAELRTIKRQFAQVWGQMSDLKYPLWQQFPDLGP